MKLKILLKIIAESPLYLKDRVVNWYQGYGFVPISYYSDPKKEIAYKTLPILNSYRKMIVMNKNWSRPDWVVMKTDIHEYSDEQLNKVWLEYLDKMILAFELVQQGVFSEQDKAKIDEGLILFAKYYQHLWD